MLSVMVHHTYRVFETKNKGLNPYRYGKIIFNNKSKFTAFPHTISIISSIWYNVPKRGDFFMKLQKQITETRFSKCRTVNKNSKNLQKRQRGISHTVTSRETVFTVSSKNRVTHFTELLRTLHKNFLIWRPRIALLFF